MDLLDAQIAPNAVAEMLTEVCDQCLHSLYTCKVMQTPSFSTRILLSDVHKQHAVMFTSD